MGKETLQDLGPADVFRTALDCEGANASDIKAFVHSLKSAKAEIGKPLLTQDGLVHLGAVLWSVSRQVLPDSCNLLYR